MIIPKDQDMVDGIENVIISLYAKGVKVSDIEEQTREVLYFYLYHIPNNRICNQRYHSLAESSVRVGISYCVNGRHCVQS